MTKAEDAWMLRESAKEELSCSIKCYDESIRDLYSAALRLAGILDRSIDKDDMITVKYQYASELINAVQMAANSTVDELKLMAENAKWYMTAVDNTEQTEQGAK